MEVRCLTCGAFMSHEAEDRECFRRETAAKVLAGFAASPIEMDMDYAADLSMAWTDKLLAKLEKSTEPKP